MPSFNNKFATLGEKFFTRVDPTPFANPVPVSFNNDAAKLLNITSKDYAEYFCGKKKFEGADYLASVYSGHQFGTYVPQLGDGRAIMIGEMNGLEVQLKGSGKTPYSRFGDGRAVLRSCIREYLCSEAMHNLGIPTTRALCIVTSDEPVQREEIEPAAMLTRIAPTHIRFGHFEYFFYTGQYNELKELADFTIKNFYTGASYEEFLEQVVIRTGKLIAKWQAYGFAHGVMNTDNMSILGITLDYGPFGFMEEYNPGFICNHSDHTGRYAFDQQPSIGLWNLYALAQSLEPLIPMDKSAEILKKFQVALYEEYSSVMRSKFGFKTEQNGDVELMSQLFSIMANNPTDYTIFFRNLSKMEAPKAYADWMKLYESRLRQENNHNLKTEMDAANPKYILRNYIAEMAIRKAHDADFSEIDKQLELLKNPFQEQPKNEEYAQTAPDWAKELCVSCSS